MRKGRVILGQLGEDSVRLWRFVCVLVAGFFLGSAVTFFALGYFWDGGLVVGFGVAFLMGFGLDVVDEHSRKEREDVSAAG